MEKHIPISQVKKYIAEKTSKDVIMLRYCDPSEIASQRQGNLMFKAKHLYKFNSLKDNGKRQVLMKMVNEWIDENLEMLYSQSHNNSKCCKTNRHVYLDKLNFREKLLDLVQAT